jgi:hypothetical protein
MSHKQKSELQKKIKEEIFNGDNDGVDKIPRKMNNKQHKQNVKPRSKSRGQSKGKNKHPAKK